MNVKEIVLTGGPCGGKTTLLQYGATKLRELGFHVVTVPEIATQLLEGGIDLDGLSRNNFTKCQAIDLQEHITLMELERRKRYKEIADLTNGGRASIILYDRGPMDQAAFIPSVEQFWAILDENQISLFEACESYDAVIHMTSAANGAEGWYSNESNPHRYETPQLARKRDNKLRDVWITHPHYKYIDNSTDFDTKLERGYSAILDAVKNSTTEIERKYVVEPLPEYFSKVNFVRVRVEQHYIAPNAKDEQRVFKTIQRGGSVHWYTLKCGEGISREEYNKAITPKEYEKTLQTSPKKKSVYKTRDFFVYNSQVFELDYIKKHDLWLLELELETKDQKVDLPPFLNIVEDVTEDSNYKNRNLAR